MLTLPSINFEIPDFEKPLVSKDDLISVLLANLTIDSERYLYAFFCSGSKFPHSGTNNLRYSKNPHLKSKNFGIENSIIEIIPPFRSTL